MFLMTRSPTIEMQSLKEHGDWSIPYRISNGPSSSAMKYEFYLPHHTLLKWRATKQPSNYSTLRELCSFSFDKHGNFSQDSSQLVKLDPSLNFVYFYRKYCQSLMISTRLQTY